MFYTNLNTILLLFFNDVDDLRKIRTSYKDMVNDLLTTLITTILKIVI